MPDKTLNILVTGVGAIIGYGVIRSLRMTDRRLNIIGTDIYEDAVGQAWCDEFVQAPYAVSDEYLGFLSDLILKRDVDLAFFGTEQEIQRCTSCQGDIDPMIYQRLVLNDPRLLELSNDKWVTREALIARGLEHLAIPSVIDGSYRSISASWGDTFLLKPRRSYASKGMHVVHDESEFTFYKERMGSQFMAQKLVGDAEHEYTVGVFGLGDGTHAGMIQMQRKLSQEGATAKAKVVFEDGLSNAVSELCRAFSPKGPTNMQFRKEGDGFLLLEINPRISSSTSIRAALGYNEAEMCLEHLLEGKMPHPSVKAGSALRFIDEIVTSA